MVSISAHAEVDLSGMSFDELIALKQQIDLALWGCEEWQEVTVPQGTYKVGEDIPEGQWTIKATEGNWASIEWGIEVDASGVEIIKRISGKSGHDWKHVLSTTYKGYKEGEDATQIDLNLLEGMYVRVDGGSAVFMPFTGKQSLGFK